MALVVRLGEPCEHMRVSSGQPDAGLATVRTAGSMVALDQVGGEFQIIQGRIHALYGSSGRLWLRAAGAECEVTGPLQIDVRVAGGIARTSVPWPLGGTLLIEEPLPLRYQADPTWDALDEESSIWGVTLKNALKGRQAMDRYWGGARGRP